MNKALHALVYVILAVAGVALFFEIKLFDKKELLTERNDQLIQALIDVAGTVEEANAPKPTSQPEARKDVSPIEAKTIETPDTENGLDEYHSELETSNNKTLQWDSKRAQLRVLYQLDGEGNKIPDPGRPGNFVKTGSGTAQELLDQLFERAKAQRANLDTTRAELQNLRRKIETLVADYNKLPPIMRQDKETIVKHEGTIADLEQQKQAVEEQMKKTKAQVDDLQAGPHPRASQRRALPSPRFPPATRASSYTSTTTSCSRSSSSRTRRCRNFSGRSARIRCRLWRWESAARAPTAGRTLTSATSASVRSRRARTTCLPTFSATGNS